MKRLKALSKKGESMDKPKIVSSQKFQLSELERSIKFSRNVLGLGRKALGICLSFLYKLSLFFESDNQINMRD